MTLLNLQGYNVFFFFFCCCANIDLNKKKAVLLLFPEMELQYMKLRTRKRQTEEVIVYFRFFLCLTFRCAHLFLKMEISRT